MVKLTRNGRSEFPDTVVYIARRLVASEIILQEFTEIEVNVSEAAKNHRARAMAELYDVGKGELVGSQRLDGQRQRTRNRFARPTTPPLAEMESPEATA